MTRSQPSCAWVRLNPILSPLASVYNANGVEKSGYAKMGAVVSLSFKVINDSCCGEYYWYSSLVIGVAVQQELSSSW